MKTLAILQARMSSSRLPGKVLRPVMGRPMLELQVERLRRCPSLSDLLVATSREGSDDPIREFCRSKGLRCSSGSLDDVLDRFYQAAKPLRPENVVRLTADCPLTDPDVNEAVVGFFESGDFDYVSNALERTFPIGLDIEVMRFAALERAWKEATLPSQREHVTPYIYQNPSLFRIGHYRNTEDLSGLRWTVDHDQDLQFVAKIYEALYPENPAFGWNDVRAYVKRHPDVERINADIRHGEGWARSLAQDADFLAGRGRAEGR